MDSNTAATRDAVMSHAGVGTVHSQACKQDSH